MHSIETFELLKCPTKHKKKSSIFECGKKVNKKTAWISKSYGTMSLTRKYVTKYGQIMLQSDRHI